MNPQLAVAECVADLLRTSPFEKSLGRWLTGFGGGIPSIENWVSIELARRLFKLPGVKHIHFNAASWDFGTQRGASKANPPCPGYCRVLHRKLLKRVIRSLPCCKAVAEASHKHRLTDHPKDLNREISPDLCLEFEAPNAMLLLELKSGRLNSPEVKADLASVHAINAHASSFVTGAPGSVSALFVYVGAEPVDGLSKDLLTYWPQASGKRGLVSNCRSSLSGGCGTVDAGDGHTLYLQ